MTQATTKNSPWRVWDIDELRARNGGKGQHWFEPGTLRFFRSRFSQTAYGTDEIAWFVSSEQAGGSHPRLYSVREFQWSTGSIGTAGEFQEYTSRSVALRVAQKLAHAAANTIYAHGGKITGESSR